MSKKSQYYKLSSQENLSTSQLLKKSLDKILDLMNLSLPNTFFFLCLFLQQALNLMFISRTYNDYKMIDAIGLSHLYINCTTLITTIGLISGFVSLGSNAYGRNNNYIMGLYINRCRIVSYGFLILMTIFNYFYAIKILSLFSIDAEILELCRGYIYKNMLMLFIETTFNINLRILTITNKSTPNMITLLVTTLLHPLWCYIFIVKLDMGLSGAAYAIILTQFLNTCSSTFYILYFNPAPGSNFFPTVECCRGLIDYLKIALPCTAVTISEWMGFEIQAFIAIKVGELAYSAHLILFSIEDIIFTFSLGQTIAIGTKVSTMIVKSSDDVDEVIDECIIDSNIYIYFGIISMTVIMIVVYIFRHTILALYITIPEIMELTLEIMPILFLYHIADNVRIIYVAIYRGLTYLNVPAIVQFVGTYVLQTILSIILAIYFELGLKGIWISLTLTNWVIMLIYAYIYYDFDFKKYRDISIKRLNKDKTNVDIIYKHDKATASEVFKVDEDNLLP
jgi:MATE family multidrug resistance protein